MIFTDDDEVTINIWLLRIRLCLHSAQDNIKYQVCYFPKKKYKIIKENQAMEELLQEELRFESTCLFA